MISTRIATGDALTVLRQLPSELAYAGIMSPPYWLTRDYEVAGQMGLEPTPREFVEKLCSVLGEFAGLRRTVPSGSSSATGTSRTARAEGRNRWR